jgi:hypothetical protein
VQVDPIEPTLTPPETKRLKPQYDEPPSKIAFKIHLCRYTVDAGDLFSNLNMDNAVVIFVIAIIICLFSAFNYVGYKAGAYTRPLLGSTEAHSVGYVWCMIFPQSIRQGDKEMCDQHGLG